MEPGDALFFHSNVLHRSDQNQSDRRRWAFLIAYNRASNDPLFDFPHPKYSKLDMVNHGIRNVSFLLCENKPVYQKLEEPLYFALPFFFFFFFFFFWSSLKRDFIYQCLAVASGEGPFSSFIRYYKFCTSSRA